VHVRSARASVVTVISAFFDFCWSEAVPRLQQIFVSTEFVIAAAIATLFGIWGVGSRIGATGTGDIALTLLAYAAIAFGFSVAGLTLVLTAPDREFASELAWSDPTQDKGLAKQPPPRSSYSNLIFIFTWTAIAHWTLVIGSIVILLGIGQNTPLLENGSSALHRIGVSILAFATVYAVELFLVTVITLANVGQAYIGRLQRTRPQD
jgi:hypothetical protein